MRTHYWLLVFFLLAGSCVEEKPLFDDSEPIAPVSREFFEALEPGVKSQAGRCHIWDFEEFQKYKDRYPLTTEEVLIVGEWSSFKVNDYDAYQYDYTFYPNHAFYVGTGQSSIRGVWQIDENVLKLKIYSYSLYIPSQGGGRSVHENKQVLFPYSFSLCRVSDLHPDGYSVRRWNLPKFPDEILQHSPWIKDEQPMHHYKYFIRFDINTLGTFHMLDWMEDMERRGFPTAEDIFIKRLPGTEDLWY